MSKKNGRAFDDVNREITNAMAAGGVPVDPGKRAPVPAEVLALQTVRDTKKNLRDALEEVDEVLRDFPEYKAGDEESAAIKRSLLLFRSAVLEGLDRIRPAHRVLLACTAKYRVVRYEGMVQSVVDMLVPANPLPKAEGGKP